jgi:arsenite methyltransferase
MTLVDPCDRRLPLTRRGDWLESPAGRRYPVVSDIPRFVQEIDDAQRQTAESFGFKWTHGAHWGFEPEHHAVVWAFWREVFGWSGPDDLRRLMAGKVVLDAGAGSGSSLNQFVDWPASIIAADISRAIDVCREHFRDRRHVTFIQADLSRLPLPDDAVDVVWSNGVLHHTPSVFDGIKALRRHLKRSGLLIFYIYRKKAPIREFVDDFVRDRVAHLRPEDAWKRMEALTAFGRSLSAITQELCIEQDLPELGIKAGHYDVQRFLYYHVLKCYWNRDLSFEDNVHVNFDWYHPQYAHRHTPDEVHAWLAELGLREQSFRVSDSGIAVVAEKT